MSNETKLTEEELREAGVKEQVTYELKDKVVYAKICTITDTLYDVEVPKQANNNYTFRTKAQDAFPDLTLEQREFIISGSTPAEWDEMFKEKQEV